MFKKLLNRKYLKEKMRQEVLCPNTGLEKKEA
jgi:hypothetical protein